MDQTIMATGEMEKIIDETMCYVKFSVGGKGFSFFKEILVMGLTGKRKNFFNRELYVRLSLVFNTTPSRVQCAIRNSVKQANKYGFMDRLNDLFGKKVIEETPSVNSAINYMLMYLRQKTGIYPDHSALLDKIEKTSQKDCQKTAQSKSAVNTKK